MREEIMRCRGEEEHDENEMGERRRERGRDEERMAKQNR